MPHCVIECSSAIENMVELNVLVRSVHDAAESSHLFTAGDVKTRLIVYQYDLVGGKKGDYVHVTIGLLSGRSNAQKKALSSTVAGVICELLPELHFISVDVKDICAETYSNRASFTQSLATDT